MRVKIHEIYITRCLQLAKNGLGNTYPNPSVGCVITHGAQIIGEGYTSAAGGHHAEVNAIKSVKDPALLKEATLYVTLEPCSHYGKTPPCADLIVHHKIPRVVIGTLDSNKEVSGRGVQKLRDAGCEVITGVLEAECRDSNRRFFCFHEDRRPWVILKWAESKDGYLAPEPELRNATHAFPFWLSGKASRQLVHRWRTEEQAILTGTRTALDDNPSLTSRDWYGRDPLRVYIDKNNRISLSSNLLDNSIPTLVFTEAKRTDLPPDHTLEQHLINKDESLPKQILEVLYRKNVQSVIIEGGAYTLESFINNGLWDEARVFTAPIVLAGGTKAPETGVTPLKKQMVGSDTLSIYRNPVRTNPH